MNVDQLRLALASMPGQAEVLILCPQNGIRPPYETECIGTEGTWGSGPVILVGG